MQFTINLAGTSTWTRQQTAGKYLVLVGTGAASSVELRIMRGGQPLEEIRTAGRGFKARMADAGGFDAVELRAAQSCAVELVISDGLVDFDFLTGAAVQASIVGLPLPVSNDRGAPGNPMSVTAVTVNDAPATSATNAAAVAVTSAGAVVVAADAATRELRLANLGPDPVAIGAAGVTWAQRVIVLEAGDVWVETRGANLAWSAITDAGKAASVTVQRVKA